MPCISGTIYYLSFLNFHSLSFTISFSLPPSFSLSLLLSLSLSLSSQVSVPIDTRSGMILRKMEINN